MQHSNWRARWESGGKTGRWDRGGGKVRGMSDNYCRNAYLLTRPYIVIARRPHAWSAAALQRFDPLGASISRTPARRSGTVLARPRSLVTRFSTCKRAAGSRAQLAKMSPSRVGRHGHHGGFGEHVLRRFGGLHPAERFAVRQFPLAQRCLHRLVAVPDYGTLAPSGGMRS